MKFEMHKHVGIRSFSFRNFKTYLIFVLFSFFLIIIYTILSFKVSKIENTINCSPKTIVEKVFPNLPLVKIYGIEETDPKLDLVKKIFRTLGYKVDISDGNNWEVLWSYTYPFYSLQNELLSLKHDQKINHFPGSGYITQKHNLALLPVENVPKAFLLPNHKKEFFQYSEENKNKFWVIKDLNHRGIRILNATQDLNTPGTLVQEFVKNPLLISGKKFDIGVYVLLTSIDPLRVYIYSGDVLLRFCKENYFPLNINSVESYVVGNDYLPVWKVNDLKFYYSELKHTAKESLNAYLRSKNKSRRMLWSQIEKTIQDVFYAAEENLKKSAMALGSLRNFFELVRFDFIVDELMNVYLLEVNMSPNLSPAHFPQNSLLYEQVMFNTLQTVGLVRKFHDNFFYRGEIEVSERDVQVNSEQCSSLMCQKSCQNVKCHVCNQCLNGEMRAILKSAYLEHVNKGKFSRVIPVPYVKENYHQKKTVRILSPMNLCMETWFSGKCQQDNSWC